LKNTRNSIIHQQNKNSFGYGKKNDNIAPNVDVKNLKITPLNKMGLGTKKIEIPNMNNAKATVENISSLVSNSLMS
jgi:hypothetical protein